MKVAGKTAFGDAHWINFLGSREHSIFGGCIADACSEEVRFDEGIVQIFFLDAGVANN